MTWLIKYTGYVSGCNEDGMRIKRGGAVKRREAGVEAGAGSSPSSYLRGHSVRLGVELWTKFRSQKNHCVPERRALAAIAEMPLLN